MPEITKLGKKVIECLPPEETSKVFIRGFVDTVEFNHINSRTAIYKMIVETQRNSGAVDRVPIKAPQRIGEVNIQYLKGETIEVEGHLQTRRYRDEKGSHLEVYVFATKIKVIDAGVDENIVYLDGYISKEPNYRLTPLGKEITEIFLAVNLANRSSAYIPVIAWGNIAQTVANYSVGDRLQIYGRFQSRKYKKSTVDGLVEKEVYEVSVYNIEY